MLMLMIMNMNIIIIIIISIIIIIIIIIIISIVIIIISSTKMSRPGRWPRRARSSRLAARAGAEQLGWQSAMN